MKFKKKEQKLNALGMTPREEKIFRKKLERHRNYLFSNEYIKRHVYKPYPDQIPEKYLIQEKERTALVIGQLIMTAIAVIIGLLICLVEFIFKL